VGAAVDLKGKQAVDAAFEQVVLDVHVADMSHERLIERAAHVYGRAVFFYGLHDLLPGREISRRSQNQ